MLLVSRMRHSCFKLEIGASQRNDGRTDDNDDFPSPADSSAENFRKSLPACRKTEVFLEAISIA
jgi:hypothetical protein